RGCSRTGPARSRRRVRDEIACGGARWHSLDAGGTPGRGRGDTRRRPWAVTETCRRATARRETSHWRLAAIVIAIAFFAGVASARAQTYPSRTITVIVPFPA